MKLREIEVRNWRGLNQSLAVLSPRLNLILGPNESGKSRIFQALQFGLFETYKGTSAQLSGGGRTLRGEDAEDALRQILGTRQPGSRGAGIDDRGIWPLIMV